MKRIAISQSNYIPWKGYFDLIDSVDEFVIYDDVQFTKNDWRNRNLIKTAHGLKWLTIPVNTSSRFGQAISDVQVADPNWPHRHWQSLVTHYSRAAFFAQYRDELAALYSESAETHLSRINVRFISAVCRWLGITTKLSHSTEYPHAGERSQRLVQICLQAGAQHYISGPAAQGYLDLDLFRRSNLEVSWMNYDGYPPYKQLHGDFEHKVSVLDLILNEGASARTFLKTGQRNPDAPR